MENILEDSKCIITTKDGPICGYKVDADEGSLYKFKSIPYAVPPLGRHRFLPPSPVKPWTELKDCTQDAPTPIQFYFNKKIIGSEDCLYIEVSTPSIEPDKQLPVMFWIGGYSFAFSVDQHCDPALINAHEVVFVRCGFRLGPFGFLSINHFIAPGNCGLKDIIMALVWVQNNIRAFGGDPTNVTIFGSSAGGAIVHLMMLSPMATGLFHKAIIQTASAINNWTLTKNPSLPVLEIARRLGIEKSCKVDIVEELRAIPVLDIMSAFVEMVKIIEGEKVESNMDAVFKPCIEDEFEGMPAFLTRYPAKILKYGHFNKVPFLIGSNNIDAAFLKYSSYDYHEDFEKYNENIELIVPRSMSVQENVSKHIGNQLLKFYVGGDERLTEDTRSQFLQMFTDYNFLYYVNKTIRLHSQYLSECPIYYYILDFVGDWFLPASIKYFNYLGHSAEIPFIFGIKLPNSTWWSGTRESLKTRDRVVKLWTNFAKYGNPTPDEDDPLLQIKWDPVESEDKLNYLNIGAELTKGRNPFSERMAFWDELHKEHMFLRALVFFNDLGIYW